MFVTYVLPHWQQAKGQPVIRVCPCSDSGECICVATKCFVCCGQHRLCGRAQRRQAAKAGFAFPQFSGSMPAPASSLDPWPFIRRGRRPLARSLALIRAQLKHRSFFPFQSYAKTPTLSPKNKMCWNMDVAGRRIRFTVWDTSGKCIQLTLISFSMRRLPTHQNEENRQGKSAAGALNSAFKISKVPFTATLNLFARPPNNSH